MGPFTQTEAESHLDSSRDLPCLFSADLSSSRDGATIEIPRREIEAGPLEPGERYRVALVAGDTPDWSGAADEPQPPVEHGEMRYVDIEDLGKQGDGIARVERGYVIIVPGSDVGDRVKIEITEVEPNFAVGEPVESI